MAPKIIRKGVRHLRLDMRNGELVVIAPENMSVERIAKVVRKHTRWIESRQRKIEQYIREAESLSNITIVFGLQRKHLPDVQELRQKLQKRAERILRQISERTGLTYRDLIIRNMQTKWASYTPNRNIVLNLRAAVLPEKHLRYILLHELVHSVIKKHNDAFWSKIHEFFGEREIMEIEKDLGKYWFYVDMNKHWRHIIGK